jgi:hypothetical protein
MLKELFMKLNVAAVLVHFLALAGLLILSSGVAMALDGIDLSAPAEESEEMGADASAEGGCPQLAQIKYPFLTCDGGEIGSTDGKDNAHATWENSRQIPLGSAWVEGDAYWGPSLNED